MDPKLDPNGLQNNGGRTQTIALQAGSPALDAGNNAAIPDGVNNDQRGQPRKVDGIVDIGAYEFIPEFTVPAAQTAYENVSQAVSGISIGTGLKGNLTVTLAVGHGKLTLGTTAGLTVTGNSSSMSLTGSTADINAALATLAYLGDLNFSGPDTLSLTASVGRVRSQASVAITVVPSAQQATDLQSQVKALL